MSVTKPSPDRRADFSRRLETALATAGKSRRALASDLGVSYEAIGTWLRAQVDCPVGWIPDMAASLGVPARDLVEDPPLASADAADPADPPPVHEDIAAPEAAFARRVIEVLESPLTAPNLMGLLTEARERLSAKDVAGGT